MRDLTPRFHSISKHRTTAVTISELWSTNGGKWKVWKRTRMNEFVKIQDFQIKKSNTVTNRFNEDQGTIKLFYKRKYSLVKKVKLFNSNFLNVG